VLVTMGRGPAAPALLPHGTTLDAANDAITVVFPHNSYEGQLRQLADFSFMLGDYEAAAGWYRKLRDELKAERTPAHYAATCEAGAVASLLAAYAAPAAYPAGPPYRDIAEALTASVSHYRRAAEAAVVPAAAAAAFSGAAAAGSVGAALGITATATKVLALRLATRAATLLADIMLVAAGAGAPIPPAAASAFSSRVRDAATLLRRTAMAEGDASLPAALCTEAAAWTVLRTVPSSHRNAARWLYQAGSSYEASGLPRHAVRCYSLALTAYGRNAAWAAVEDVLLQALARLLAPLGDAGTAAGFLSHILGSGAGAERLTPKAQLSVLRDFLGTHILWTAARGAGGSSGSGGGRGGSTAAAELSALRLPAVDVGGVTVASFPNAAAARVAADALAPVAALEALNARRAIGRWAAPTNPDALAAAGPTYAALAASVAPPALADWLSRALPTAPLHAAAAAAGTGDVALPLTNLAAFPGPASMPWTASQPLPTALPLHSWLATLPGDGLWGGGGGSPAEGAAPSEYGGGRLPPATAVGAILGAMQDRRRGGGEDDVATSAARVAFGLYQLTRPSTAARPAGMPTAAAGLGALVATVPPSHAPAVVAALAALASGALLTPSAAAAADGGSGSDGGAASGSAWARIEAMTLREARDADRTGGRPDWARVVHDLAVSAEDDAEVRERNAGSSGGAGIGGADGSSGPHGAQDEDGDWFDGMEQAVYLAGGEAEGAAAGGPLAVAQAVAQRGEAAMAAWGASFGQRAAYHPSEALARVAERGVGEPVAVCVPLRNPLAVPLPLLACHPVYEWTASGPTSSGDSAGETSAARTAASWDEVYATAAAAGPLGDVACAGAAFTPTDVYLQPGECRTLRLLLRAPTAAWSGASCLPASGWR